MMNMEKKLGKIVEPFDQKDELDLGERQGKTYLVRTRLTAPAIGQKVSIEQGPKRNVERSFLICNGETILNVVARPAGLHSRSRRSARDKQ